MGVELRRLLAACVVVALSTATATWASSNSPRGPWKGPRPLDDGSSFGYLENLLSHDERIGLFRVESEHPTMDRIREDLPPRPVRLCVTRVMEGLHGLRTGEVMVFSENPEDTPSNWPSPKLVVGKTYLIFPPWLDGPYTKVARELGFTGPIIEAGYCTAVRTDLWDLNAVMPQLREYVRARFLPEPACHAPLRRWALANLNSSNAFLRRIVRNDISDSWRYYPGATKEEATRLIQYSDEVGGYQRFNILKHLALHTDIPMDQWFLRAVSRGAPGQIRPDNMPEVFAFSDAIYLCAHKLSIDSFWPILDLKTRSPSPWVMAFAQKADPRLLPVILRHLAPGEAHRDAVRALKHYKGRAEAVRALVDLARNTKSLDEDTHTRTLVVEALEVVDAEESRAEAKRLRKLGPLDPE